MLTNVLWNYSSSNSERTNIDLGKLQRALTPEQENRCTPHRYKRLGVQTIFVLCRGDLFELSQNDHCSGVAERTLFYSCQISRRHCICQKKKRKERILLIRSQVSVKIKLNKSWSMSFLLEMSPLYQLGRVRSLCDSLLNHYGIFDV